MPLRRDDVVAAALGILDHYGLADLTMRRLASTLGVQAGALYWHFRSKQDLLAAVSDVILADLPALPAEPEADWPVTLRLWSARLHAALRSRRSGAELVSGVLALRGWDASPGAGVEAYLRANAVPPKPARAAASALVYLVLGHCMDEEQADLLAELGVRASGAEPDSARVLDAGVALLLDGVLAQPPG